MLQPNSSPWKAITSSLPDILKTPEKKKHDQTNHQLFSENGSPLPSTFKFTPTKGRKLYPHLNPPDKRLLNSSPSNQEYHSSFNHFNHKHFISGSNNNNMTNNMTNNVTNNNDVDESYMVKDNTSFISAMDTLGKQLFSSNISNKVMNEFSSRYEKVREETISNVQEINNTTTNEQLNNNRRNSGRFSLTHRNRFNRMESIAFHYAAKRSKENGSNINNMSSSPNKISDDYDGGDTNNNNNDNDVMMVDNNNNSRIYRKLVPAVDSIALNDNTTLTPSDKRAYLKPPESASKRLRLDEQHKYKEIDSSPTKSLSEREQLKHIYSPQLENENHYFKNIKPLYAPKLKPKNDIDTNIQLNPIESSPTKIEVSPTSNQVHDYNNTDNTNIPSYLQPTKSSLRKSNSNRQLSPSKSTKSLSSVLSDNLNTPVLKPQDSYITHTNGLSKSPSISPARSKSPSRNSSPISKISPSRAFSNLNKILNTPPTSASNENFNSKKSKEDEQQYIKTKIPRSKTLGQVDQHSSTIVRSKTANITQIKSQIPTHSHSSNNIRTLSGSSSIPRLAKLANVESRFRQASKHNLNNPNNNEKTPKPWR